MRGLAKPQPAAALISIADHQACPERAGPRCDARAVHDAIGHVLRAAYDDLKREPVPAHLVALVRRLDRKGP
jgi:hypothetical protein